MANVYERVPTGQHRVGASRRWQAGGWVVLAALTLTTGAVAADRQQAPVPAPAGWRQLRGDPQMSGRATGTGLLTATPPLAWRYDIAAWEGYLSVVPEAAEQAVELPFGTAVEPEYMAANQAAWGLGPQAFDLGGGNRVSMAVDYRFKVAKILADVPGLQRFEMDDSFADAGAAPKRGRLLAYDTGAPRVVWETESFTDVWAPNVIVVDADADGQLDVAVATHYRILVFDGATGATKMQLRYHDYRNYGWFGAANIDADPFPEFCVVADFSMHAEVIDNDGQRLSLRWLRRIQTDPSQSTKVVRPRPTVLTDLDGDGAVEVVFSLYNDSGDAQWHLLILDALSGTVRFDFPQCYLHGSGDLDGDGRPELLVGRTRGEPLPRYAPLAVWTFAGKGQDPVERWTCPLGHFCDRPLDQLPLEVASGAADGLRTAVLGDVDGDGRMDLFVSEPAPDGAGEVLKACSLAADEAGRTQWRLIAPPGMALQAVAVADVGGQRRALVQFKGRSAAGQSLSLAGSRGVLHQWGRQSYTPAGTPVVADLEGDGTVEVVVQAGTEEILCLEALAGGTGAPRPRWQVPGYGQTNNAPYHWGVVAADVDGDHELEVLAAREAASGSASLTAVAADGRLRWQTEFPGFDGSMPVWNFSGLSYWNVGHYTAPDRLGVFASLRRGKIGSEVGYMLEGSTGQIRWESRGYSLPADGSGRSLGGHPSASGDLDGDGLDEIVVMWPDRLHVVDGASGAPQVVRQAYSYAAGIKPIFASQGFVGYAFPAIVDLVGDAAPELLWGHCGYVTGLLTAAGECIWQTPYANNTEVQSLMVPGDADGDGDLELVASLRTGVHLLDPGDGAVLQALSELGPATTDLVAGDVDGDGRDEFLFAQYARIYCLGLGSGGFQVEWSLDLGGSSSDLALADVSGDGRLDLVVCTADGYVNAYVGRAPSGGTLVAPQGDAGGQPLKPTLAAPYPNPFNGQVVFRYQVSRPGPVRLDVVDLAGQCVQTLAEGYHSAGPYQVCWHSGGSAAPSVASGTYLVRLRSAAGTEVRKVLLLK